MDNPFQSPQAVDNDASLPEVGPPYVFEGLGSAQQLLQATRLAMRWTPRGLVAILGASILPLFAIFGIAICAMVSWTLGVFVPLPLFFSGFAIAWILWERYQNNRYLRRQLNELERAIGVLRRITIDEAGMRTKTEEREVLSDWSRFSSYRADREVLVLFNAGSSAFVPFHRDNLETVDAWPSLIKFVAERLPRK